MTRSGLLFRNLRYFRAANLALVAGMAVATAVLTGALLVGDSVRGSLRDLALQRLGPVDYALVAPHFFDQSLADRLAAQEEFASRFEVVPALLGARGASDESGEHRTGGVQIAAMGAGLPGVKPGECIVNDALADSLVIRSAEGRLTLNVPAPGDLPRDAALARRSTDEVTSRPQLYFHRIVGEPSFMSYFNLEGGQRTPRNAWMNLADLQREARQPGRVNLLLVRSRREVSTPAEAAELNEMLRRSIRLADYGLKLSPTPTGDERVLSSRTTYIPPAVDRAAERTGKPLSRVSVQLINNVVRLNAAGTEGESIHYAVAAGISALGDAALAEDEVVLNEWAAQHLHAKVGDRIRLDYYQRRPDGELAEVHGDRAFRVGRIIPMTGLGADRTLTPDYPGLTDKASIREAPPELGIKEELLGGDDEAYWTQYRATPKLFLNLQTTQRLWGENYGNLTSIRIAAQQVPEFERELLQQLDPASLGMSFRPIKAEQLAAAGGGTDFSMLFVGLSFFLIASAVLLVAMLFRLSVEARARQFGILGAMGFAPHTLVRLARAEGAILACVGGLMGIICAIGYTLLMVTGLRTWWVDAVGTTSLRPHIDPVTLVIGFVAGLVIALLAVVWAARSLQKIETSSLLHGIMVAANDLRTRRRRFATLLTVAGVVGGIAMLAAGVIGVLSAQAAFFGGGSLLLVGSLAAVARALRSDRRRSEVGRWSIEALAARTAGRHPARSLLTVSLIALASFLLVTVAAMRQGPPNEAGVKQSGTGGYRLILQADIPLLADLNTRQGRQRLGMREPDALIWSSARFTSLRRWAGQDASCLNLTRPESPTILGVPPEMIEQNRFKIASAIEDLENPWKLLTQPTRGPDEIPVIADDETAHYILKLGLGDAMVIRDQSGGPRTLRLVATLAGSMLQSELLMSEASFRRLFPFTSGFGVVLMETDATHAPELARTLGRELDAFAVTVDSTSDRLAAYKQVANTYLSTFQALGSLGLLLGTAGLAVVLLRGMIERRSELALLSAIGFSPGRLLRLVLGENAALLLLGMLTGMACAVVAILPAVLGGGRGIRLSGLVAALASVLLTGLVVLTLAAWLGGRNITPADLRSE